MFNITIGVGLAIVSSLVAAAPKEKLEIDSNTAQRTICNVEFAKVNGLTIHASRIPEAQWKTRVDIERYSACPYDVRMVYNGQSLRIDFSKSLTQEMVEKYEPGLDVNTGFFHLDSDGWVANDELLPNAENKITVEATERDTLIVGLVRPLPDIGQPQYVCFSVALIGQQGLATGAICSPNNKAPLTFAKLFSEKRIISSK